MLNSSRALMDFCRLSQCEIYSDVEVDESQNDFTRFRVVSYHDVVWLQVPVADLGLVYVVDSADELPCQALYLF